MKRPLYLIISSGKLELPVAVGDNMADLSRQTGRSIANLCHTFNRARRSGWKKGMAREVWVDFSEKEWRELHEEQKNI